MADTDRTASLMTPSKLAQVKPKAPATPAAWLDQMAADAGHAHAQRLTELRGELLAHGRGRDLSPMVSQLARLGEALPQLDFGLLQTRGWWARTTGRSRNAGTEFARQFEQIDEVARALGPQAQALQKRLNEQASANDRAQLELEVEFRALDKITDQGTRWLHDMRNQIKVRQAEASDEAGRQQVGNDAARCEILVARLKVLRALGSAAQQAHQQAPAAAARRAALSKLLSLLASDVKAWQASISALAAAAGNGDAPAPGLDDPMKCHRDLQLRVKQALADCGELQHQEKVLADSLAAMDAQFEAGA
ncbi:MAG: hypothetical protein H0X13_01580 [Ramlibacter sp.]|nr:hypothetical protein [Ramlibacter sp.]